jgi:hypothetical protein
MDDSMGLRIGRGDGPTRLIAGTDLDTGARDNDRLGLRWSAPSIDGGRYFYPAYWWKDKKVKTPQVVQVACKSSWQHHQQ